MQVVESETDALDRLRAFTIRLYEWCDPLEKPRKRGTHNRRPIVEFSVQLASEHPEQVKAAMAPITHKMLELVEAANAAGAIDFADARRAAALLQQTVMYSWFSNRLAESARLRLTAEETWDFCLHGLRAAH
jgi:AcrR family transcriptional regulator